MAYRPDSTGPVRDKAYASEIAAQRPLLAPRIHCEDDYEERRENDRASIRGDQGYEPDPPPYSTATSAPSDPGPRRGEITEDRVALFNRQLREGLGTSRPDDTDE